jgi:DNA repair protein RadC
MALGPGMLLDYLECFMSYSKHIKRPSSNVIDGPAKAIDYVRARAQPSDSDMIYCLYVDCENEVSFMDAFVNETSRDVVTYSRKVLKQAVELNVPSVVFVVKRVGDEMTDEALFDSVEHQTRSLEIALTVAGINVLDWVLLPDTSLKTRCRQWCTSVGENLGNMRNWFRLPRVRT